jgi:hypothetical protein
MMPCSLMTRHGPSKSKAKLKSSDDKASPCFYLEGTNTNCSEENKNHETVKAIQTALV